jgi:hypothetical protein
MWSADSGTVTKSSVEMVRRNTDLVILVVKCLGQLRTFHSASDPAVK